MFSEFQEVSPVETYVFSGKSRSVAPRSKIKKLTVSQELLNDIINISGFSIKKISEETHISIGGLHRIKSGETKHPNNKTFDSLFKLYCRVCQ